MGGRSRSVARSIHCQVTKACVARTKRRHYLVREGDEMGMLVAIVQGRCCISKPFVANAARCVIGYKFASPHDRCQVDYLHTSGGRTTAASPFIRAEALHNPVTWAGVHSASGMRTPFAFVHLCAPSIEVPPPHALPGYWGPRHACFRWVQRCVRTPLLQPKDRCPQSAQCLIVW